MTMDDGLSWVEPDLRRRLHEEPEEVLRGLGVNLPPGLPLNIIHEAFRIVSLIWIDGKTVPREQFRIDPNDEGLLFGRGVWESTRTIDGVPWLWDMHIERMLATAKLLEIDLPAERLPSAERVKAYVRELTNMEVVIRLNASAGAPGQRGVVWMSASVPPRPLESVTLKSKRTPNLRSQPDLAWKTFQYGGRLRLGKEAHKDGFDTTLVLDTNDNLLEAAHANIFVRFPDGWATPSNEAGLFLPGTLRRRLLEASPLPIQERTIPLASLAQATEVFVTNSNVGIVPVVKVDTRTFAIGNETRTLQKWLG